MGANNEIEEGNGGKKGEKIPPKIFLFKVSVILLGGAFIGNTYELAFAGL